MNDDGTSDLTPPQHEAMALAGALVGLIELESPVAEAAATVEAAIAYCAAWVLGSEPLATLHRTHLRALIRAVLAETITAEEARLWACTLQDRSRRTVTARPLVLLEHHYQTPIRMVLASMAAAADDSRCNYGMLMPVTTEGLDRMLAVLDCENPTGPTEFGYVNAAKASKLLRALRKRES